FSRMEKMQVPPIDFYQLKVSYETLIVDEANDSAKRLQDNGILAQADMTLIHQQDLEGKLIATYEQENTEETNITFGWWLHQIAKESFGMLNVADLKTCEKELLDIFARITTNKGGNTIENKKFDHQRIRSLIRQAFAPVRDFKVTEEVVPCKASLLQIEKLTSPMDDDGRYYPAQEDVHIIKEWDDNPPKTEITEEVRKLLEQLKALGQDVSKLIPQQDPHPERNQTYHYLPYRFDSSLEKDYFSSEIIPLIKDKNLEIYFNGDDTLTEFKINCYNRIGSQWRYIGRYVPDFLLLSRNAENEIDKVIIIETKGEGFAAKFADKRKFMETEFVKKNNEKFGYQRFEFLYLEDTMSPEQRRQKTLQTIKDFFNL
ncbi:MAG: restriction endonuclease subunit R, partial [Bacteroidales bacterium]|nr:restriction endonuclease subunit R [Bacteroidales bacterium]